MARTSKRPARRTTPKRAAPRRVPAFVVNPDTVDEVLRSQRQSIAQIDYYGLCDDQPTCARSGFAVAYSKSMRNVEVEYFSRGESGPRTTAEQKAAKRSHIKTAARILRSAGLAPKVSASGYRVSVKAGR